MDPLKFSAETRLLMIAGAPRCGTTAMSRYLGRHPSVCLSNPKETHFFLDRRSADDPEQGRQAYRRKHFRHAKSSHEMLLDGSISCLYSPDSARRAIAVFPNARFLVMLRNPVDLIESYHSRLLFYRQETETELRAAWNLQDRRRAGDAVPWSCSDPDVLRYKEVGLLGKHLETLLDVVGRDRCHWIFHKDLIQDPLGVYRDTLAFAGLPYDGRTEFPRKAPNRAFRNRWVQLIYSGAILAPLIPVGPSSTAVYGRIRTLLKPIRKRIRSLNAYDAPPRGPDRETRALLLDAFADDIDRLERVTGRNLDEWRGDSGPYVPDQMKIPKASNAAHGIAAD